MSPPDPRSSLSLPGPLPVPASAVATLPREQDIVIRNGLLALLLTLPLPLLSDYSGLDIWLENLFFDSATMSFPWRSSAWFEAVTHDGIRTLLLMLGGINLLALLLAFFSPSLLRPLPIQWRQPRLLGYLLVSTMSGPAIVGLLKKHTTHECPWNLTMYGGHSVYSHILSSPLFTLTDPGKCFPGGHASGGFALLALVPVLQGRRRWQMLVLVLALGLLMGWSRMMQGAHFLSHNLWSAWICWALTLFFYALFKPGNACATIK